MCLIPMNIAPDQNSVGRQQLVLKSVVVSGCCLGVRVGPLWPTHHSLVADWVWKCDPCLRTFSSPCTKLAGSKGNQPPDQHCPVGLFVMIKIFCILHWPIWQPPAPRG